MKKYIWVLSILMLSACASAPSASPEMDQAAKQFPAAPTGMSQVYIFRDEGYGFAISMDVTLDGQMLGKTGALTYFFLTIPPGQHTITSKAGNTDTLTLDAKAGETYYVWQEIKSGFMSAGTALHLVATDRGQRGVNRCTRIADNQTQTQ